MAHADAHSSEPVKLLAIWGASRSSQELAAFAVPELQTARHGLYRPTAYSTQPAPQPLQVQPAKEHASNHLQLCWVEGPDMASMAAAASTCVLLNSLIQVWAVGSSLEAALAAWQVTNHEPALHSWSLRVLVDAAKGLGNTQTGRAVTHELHTHNVGCTPVAGSPTLCCLVLQGGKQYILGRQVAQGRPSSRAPHSKLGSMPHAPVGLQPDHALLTARLAHVTQGSCVLDPFAGGGSILQACISCGAAVAVGCDADEACFTYSASGTGQFQTSMAASTQELVLSNCLQSVWRCGRFDAIVCDPPYGQRTDILTPSAACQRAHLPADSTAGQGTMTRGIHSSTSDDGAGSAARNSDGSEGGCIDSTSSACGSAAQAAAANAGLWPVLIQALFGLAGSCLVAEGRLAAWVPYPVPGTCTHADARDAPAVARRCGNQSCQGAYSGQDVGLHEHLVGDRLGKDRPSSIVCSSTIWLASQAEGAGLVLVELLPERRKGGITRALAVFVKPAVRGKPNGAVAEGPAIDQHQSGVQHDVVTVCGMCSSEHEPDNCVHFDTMQVAAHQCADLAVNAPHPHKAAGDALRAGGALDLQRHKGYAHSRRTRKGAEADVWRAAWMGDTAALAAYFAASGDPNAQDSRQQTPLHFAAGYGQVAALSMLLENGADIAAKDAGGGTVLHRAAARGHTAVVRVLLGSSANPAALDSGGYSALHQASQFGHSEAVSVLLQADASLCDLLVTAGFSPLHLACRWGHVQVVDLLINQGGASTDVRSRPEGLTPAHLAARWGHVQVLERLHAHGADLDVNAINVPHGDCPMHAREGAESVPAHTPLGEAVKWRRPACVAFLRYLLVGKWSVSSSKHQV